MRTPLAILVVMVAQAWAQSQPGSLMAVPASRATLSLDGTWNTIVDPYETGLSSRYFEKARPHSKSDLLEFDFDHSPKLHVPGDWNTQRESLLFYEGPLWYQRNFRYQKKQKTRTFLYFGAANYDARVWLNGVKLGEHVGGFTPFDFEITAQVEDGENSIVVEVNNARQADGVPALRTDWWNYGGLTRGVQLVEVPEVFIENYSLHLAKGGKGQRIDGWVKLNVGTPGLEATIEIPEAGILYKTAISSGGTATVNLDAEDLVCGAKQASRCQDPLQPWTTEKPKLYRVTIRAGSDGVTDEIGFRMIETRGAQILLNGSPIFLRGINIHEEAPFRGGRAYSEEDARTLLMWAKELGCNFVRLAHYPHNENMVRLADQMGILVWEEVPVYWDIQWENSSALENAKAQLRDVILRDQNRAAVILWSLSNETPISSARNAFLKSMAEYARSLDASRLITSASDKFDRADPQTYVLNDPLTESLDVLGVNEYIGWYYRKPEDADHIQWKSVYEKPVIVSEFGADALYNLHGDAETRFSEEYQANLYEHQLPMISRIPGLVGLTPWILMDFHSPRRPLPGIQDYFNRKGLISDRGQRKQAFYVLQRFYRGQAGAAPR